MSNILDPRLLRVGFFAVLLLALVLVLREPIVQMASRTTGPSHTHQAAAVVATDKASRLTQLGIAHTGGVPVVAIQESDIDMTFITAMWNSKAQDLDLHGKNITAVI